jgi:dTDP-4-amino-4,6-dideoxygalactose transaminase
MNIPFLDLKSNAKIVKEEVLTSITDIIDNSAFVGGKYVASFEERFAVMHQMAHCIGVSSGTAGNHLALWALGVGHGDEVIIPVNTFIATAWGATLCGATPVFVDNDPESYNIDVTQVEAAITPRTKAIVAVHLYGQSADMAPLQEIATKHGIYLVEDAAQAHLATYNGLPVGHFGVTSSFSFYPGKNLGAFGEGGAVVTQDDAIAQRIAMIKDHGSVEKYQHPIEGHNYRMSNIIGASLDAKLSHIEVWTEARRANAVHYNQHLSDIEEITLPQEMPYAKHVYHLYVIRTPKRDALMAYLAAHGIASGMHYPIPLHQQEVFAHLGYAKGDFPVAEAQTAQILSLPMYPELTQEQIAFIAQTIKTFFTEEA